MLCPCTLCTYVLNLTFRWSLLVQDPITLYSAVDLLVIWYWKMSYLPGASPFSLKTTGVLALPGNKKTGDDEDDGGFCFNPKGGKGEIVDSVLTLKCARAPSYRCIFSKENNTLHSNWRKNTTTCLKDTQYAAG